MRVVTLRQREEDETGVIGKRILCLVFRKIRCVIAPR